MGLFSRMKSKPPGSPTVRFRPSLDTLEAREVPATFASELGGVLTITGDGTVNKVEIKDNGTGGPGSIRFRLDSPLSFEDDARPWRRTTTTIHTIVVNTGANNDIVRYRLTNHLGAWNTRDLQVNAGSGNDIVWGEVRGDLHTDSSLRMVVSGGTGDDQLAAFGFGDIHARASLGISFSGDTGHDNIWALMDNDVDISPNGTLWMNMWGGDGNDYFGIEYDGDLDGRLLLHLEGGNHDDTVRARVRMDAASTGTVGDPNAPPTVQGNWNRVATVSGDAGNDDLDFRVFYPVADEGNHITATISGGSGTDRFTHTHNVGLVGPFDPGETATFINKGLLPG